MAQRINYVLVDGLAGILLMQLRETLFSEEFEGELRSGRAELRHKLNNVVWATFLGKLRLSDMCGTRFHKRVARAKVAFVDVPDTIRAATRNLSTSFSPLPSSPTTTCRVCAQLSKFTTPRSRRKSPRGPPATTLWK